MRLLLLLLVLSSLGSCRPPSMLKWNGKYRLTDNAKRRSNRWHSFHLHDTSLVDTNSIYVRTYRGADSTSNDSSTIATYVFYRFYSNGNVYLCGADTIPASKDLNEENIDGFDIASGVYRIHNKRIKIWLLDDYGLSYQKPTICLIENYELLEYDRNFPFTKRSTPQHYDKLKILGK